MTNERKSPERKAVATEDKVERSREAEAFSNFEHETNDIENTEVKQTDSRDGTQTELRSLRDALWEAINGIEEKAPGAPIERELIILDHLTEGLGNIMYKAEADTMRRGASCIKESSVVFRTRSTVPTAWVQSYARTMRQYDLIADWYAADRGRTIGVAEALAVAATLPPHSRILDLGCGNGVPITEALVNAGHRVVGLDSSSGMLALFRANLPNTPVVRADARQCPFAAGEFDAAISWGMIFHLPRVDQPAVFESVSRVLKPGALFLFTAAEIAGGNDSGITGG